MIFLFSPSNLTEKSPKNGKKKFKKKYTPPPLLYQCSDQTYAPATSKAIWRICFPHYTSVHHSVENWKIYSHQKKYFVKATL